jgi:hypothetical protein
MMSIRSIAAAGIKRFGPGCLWFFGTVFIVSAGMKEMTIGPAQIAGFAELTLSMFVGYVAAMAATRLKIAPSANVEGARSKLAGFAAPVVLLGIDMLRGRPTPHLLSCAFAFVAGAATTALLFAPWMTHGARSSAFIDDDLAIDGVQSVLADQPPPRFSSRTSHPTKTPRQISSISAD